MIKESVGVDSLNTTIAPSSQNTNVYPNINSPTQYEGIRNMEINEKFKELFAKLGSVREIENLSTEIQAIISQEQDRVVGEDASDVSAYMSLIDQKERFVFLNQVIASLEKEVMELASEILGSIPTEEETEDDEEEDEDTEEETEEDTMETEEDLEAELGAEVTEEEEEPKEKKESVVLSEIEKILVEMYGNWTVDNVPLDKNFNLFKFKDSVHGLWGLRKADHEVVVAPEYSWIDDVGVLNRKTNTVQVRVTTDRGDLSLISVPVIVPDSWKLDMSPSIKSKIRGAMGKIKGVLGTKESREAMTEEFRQVYVNPRPGRAFWDCYVVFDDYTEAKKFVDGLGDFDAQIGITGHTGQVEMYSVSAITRTEAYEICRDKVKTIMGESKAVKAIRVKRSTDGRKSNEWGDEAVKKEKERKDAEKKESQLREKANSKHVSACANDLSAKMTDKQIDVVIQSYYDENEIGGSFASFKKAVLNQFKSKKESQTTPNATLLSEMYANWGIYNVPLKSNFHLSSFEDEKTGLFGLEDDKGNIVVEPKYDWIDDVGVYNVDKGMVRIRVNKDGHPDSIDVALETTPSTKEIHFGLKQHIQNAIGKIIDYSGEDPLLISNPFGQNGMPYSRSRKGLSQKESRIVEKTTNHVAKCAGELDPETMSVKDMSSSIQTYYDENEIGGSFAQFKKEVISHLSKK